MMTNIGATGIEEVSYNPGKGDFFDSLVELLAALAGAKSLRSLDMTLKFESVKEVDEEFLGVFREMLSNETRI